MNTFLNAKKIIAASAMTLFALASLSSCKFNPGQDEPEDNTVTVELEIEATDLGNWDKALTIPATDLEEMKEGDYITIVTTKSELVEAEYFQVAFYNSKWDNLMSTEESENATYSEEYGSYSLLSSSQSTVFVPSAQDLADIKENGLIIKGYGVKVTQVSVTYGSLETCADKHATANTKRLYRYLKSIYGNHVLTGQMENAWNYECNMLGRVYEDTGKYPALLGFDFMNYTSLGWPANNQETERAINYWQGKDLAGNKISDKHGIVQFMWHWRDPTADSGTTGSFTPSEIAFRIPYDTKTDTWKTDTTEYKEMMKDLDVVAAEFLKLQNAGVPVIWRPMHEANGNLGGNWEGASAWFWWGAGSTTGEGKLNSEEKLEYKVSEDIKECGECFIALWKLMFNYFTETKGIHNLIWLWNGQDINFYPGDEYVDIIGDDIYDKNSSTRYSGQKALFKKFQDMSKKKMVCMSECGAFPSMSNIQKEGAWWLYFMVWNDQYTENGAVTRETNENNFWSGEWHNTQEHKEEVYKSDIAITLDELPDLTSF